MPWDRQLRRWVPGPVKPRERVNKKVKPRDSQTTESDRDDEEPRDHRERSRRASARRETEGRDHREKSRVEAHERREAARVEAARVEAARVEAARVEAARVEAARVEAARVEAARVEAARVKAARVESERIKEIGKYVGGEAGDSLPDSYESKAPEESSKEAPSEPVTPVTTPATTPTAPIYGGDPSDFDDLSGSAGFGADAPVVTTEPVTPTPTPTTTPTAPIYGGDPSDFDDLSGQAGFGAESKVYTPEESYAVSVQNLVQHLEDKRQDKLELVDEMTATAESNYEAALEGAEKVVKADAVRSGALQEVVDLSNEASDKFVSDVKTVYAEGDETRLAGQREFIDESNEASQTNAATLVAAAENKREALEEVAEVTTAASESNYEAALEGAEKVVKADAVRSGALQEVVDLSNEASDKFVSDVKTVYAEGDETRLAGQREFIALQNKVAEDNAALLVDAADKKRVAAQELADETIATAESNYEAALEGAQKVVEADAMRSAAIEDTVTTPKDVVTGILTDPEYDPSDKPAYGTVKGGVNPLDPASEAAQGLPSPVTVATEAYLGLRDPNRHVDLEELARKQKDLSQFVNDDGSFKPGYHKRQVELFGAGDPGATDILLTAAGGPAAKLVIATAKPVVRAAAQGLRKFYTGSVQPPGTQLAFEGMLSGTEQAAARAELSAQVKSGDYLRTSSAKGDVTRALDELSEYRAGLGPSAPPSRPYVDRMMREWIDSQGGTPSLRPSLSPKGYQSQVREASTALKTRPTEATSLIRQAEAVVQEAHLKGNLAQVEARLRALQGSTGIAPEFARTASGLFVPVPVPTVSPGSVDDPASSAVHPGIPPDPSYQGQPTIVGGETAAETTTETVAETDAAPTTGGGVRVVKVPAEVPEITGGGVRVSAGTFTTRTPPPVISGTVKVPAEVPEITGGGVRVVKVPAEVPEITGGGVRVVKVPAEVPEITGGGVRVVKVPAEVPEITHVAPPVTHVPPHVAPPVTHVPPHVPPQVHVPPHVAPPVTHVPPHVPPQVHVPPHVAPPVTHVPPHVPPQVHVPPHVAPPVTHVPPHVPPQVHVPPHVAPPVTHVPPHVPPQVHVPPHVAPPVTHVPPHTPPQVHVPPHVAPPVTHVPPHTPPATHTTLVTETAPAPLPAAAPAPAPAPEPAPRAPGLPLPPPTEIAGVRPEETFGRTTARGLRDREAPAPANDPIPAARPEGAFPRQIQHNEEVLYRFDPATGALEAQLIKASEPVITQWDQSAPDRAERKVGTWLVRPNNNGVAIEGRSSVTALRAIEADLREEAQRSGGPVERTVSQRVHHDLDLDQTQVQDLRHRTPDVVQAEQIAESEGYRPVAELDSVDTRAPTRSAALSLSSTEQADVIMAAAERERQQRQQRQGNRKPLTDPLERFLKANIAAAAERRQAARHHRRARRRPKEKKRERWEMPQIVISDDGNKRRTIGL